MYAQDIMTIGELMEIKIDKVFIKTKLQELSEDGRFTVFHPTIKGLPVMLETGEMFTMRFYRPNGIFTFDALLEDWYTKDDIRLCRFMSCTEVAKAQRRQSYRLPIVLDVAIRLKDAADEEADRVYKGKTVDLSEHGMLLTCFACFPMDTEVYAELKLSPVRTIALHAKVIRCEKSAERENPHRIVLLFMGRSDRQRTELSRYIMHQQIIARKKKNQEVLP